MIHAHAHVGLFSQNQLNRSATATSAPKLTEWSDDDDDDDERHKDHLTLTRQTNNLLSGLWERAIANRWSIIIFLPGA